MLKILLNENIFDKKYSNIKRIVAHGCNAQGVMGSGIALTIKTLYPQAYEDYVNKYIEKGLDLGEVIFSHVSEDLIIANCITQRYYGTDKGRVYVDYEALDNALRKVAHESIITSSEIHIPYIGGGRANGDRDYLMHIFENYNATLFILD